MNPTAPKLLDVRSIVCREKHATIFKQWHELAVGDAFVLVNDHDPVPLYYQFSAMFPDAFDWTYVEDGPDVFQVRITRLRETSVATVGLPPRSSCGGRHHHEQEPMTVRVETRGDELDVRGLEPPQPMIAILEVVEELAPGAVLLARTDRNPLHLLPELDRRGFEHSSSELPDGSWRTRITRR